MINYTRGRFILFRPHFFTMNKMVKFAPMIREAIKNEIERIGISKRRCALDNELIYTHFCAFLRGDRPIPINDIEKVLRYLKLKIKK